MKPTIGNSPCPFILHPHWSNILGRKGPSVGLPFLSSVHLFFLPTCQPIYMNKIHIEYEMVSRDVLENLPLNNAI